ncbi:MAG: uroporphyrinogen-III synthase [Candidatus Thiodiazotropha sp. (ex Monitilora ramsayi)]|nr:uroporphyrinogen-III synthase [Candidatus Thiodiazotropha sp. (ex Monitilora ramsayi)]
MKVCDLGGRGVLVTRAYKQSAGICHLIESQGGRAVRFPALEIVPGSDRASALAQLHQAYDLVVFISPNAVRHASDLLSGTHIKADRFCAVGKATETAMREAGYPIDLIPEHRYDSEGVLAIPALQQMAGQQVLIVRGQGGRALLGDTLCARGAKVGYAEVYRRRRPDADSTPLLRNWSDSIDLVTATSAEVLDNLIGMLGDEGWPMLRQTPLLVISDRMREAAEVKGFKTILQAEGADDTSIMAAICDWVDRVEQH